MRKTDIRESLAGCATGSGESRCRRADSPFAAVVFQYITLIRKSMDTWQHNPDQLVLDGQQSLRRQQHQYSNLRCPLPSYGISHRYPFSVQLHQGSEAF